MAVKEQKKPVLVKSIQEIHIGPKRFTKYEKARVVAARALQLAAGAPPLIDVSKIESRDPVVIAYHELLSGVLPLLIKRVKPSGEYQLIPVKILAEVEKDRVGRLQALAEELFDVHDITKYII
jgi:DNA-directed RNA polymerase subunit K/omega